MVDYSTMSVEELETELKRQRELLEDMHTERSFMGRQVGMHINASEFARLDRDIAKTEERIAELEKLLSEKKS